jgi:hypothetical protein
LCSANLQTVHPSTGGAKRTRRSLMFNQHRRVRLAVPRPQRTTAAPPPWRESNPALTYVQSRTRRFTLPPAPNEPRPPSSVPLLLHLSPARNEPSAPQTPTRPRFAGHFRPGVRDPTSAPA